MRQSVIYCRVSSERQAKEGHGIEGQERNCRQYAASRGYTVVQVFTDEGISGGVLDRPGIEELLGYLSAHRKDRLVVIIDDLKRLARDVVTHFQLKKLITARNATLESTTHSFEETPEGKFMETIFAATAELERNQNKKQVQRRMRARLEAGYWTFYPPPGYSYAQDPRHGKVIVPKEPEASIIREALEGFASGRLPTQVAVQAFLQQKGVNHARRGTMVYLDQVKRLLTQELYAGHLYYPPWQVTRRKGHHTPLVSPETFDRIQNRLRGREKLPRRKDLHQDFPLRGFVLCGGCEKSYTASWSRGRSAKHPYYRCVSVGCPFEGKSIRADQMHEEFAALLGKLRPRQNIVEVVRAELLDLWQAKRLTVEELRRERQRKLDGIEKQITGYLDALDRCHSPTVIRKVEEQIDDLEAKKLRLGGRIEKPVKGEYDFETALDRVLGFLKDPLLMWETGDLGDRRLVLRLVFEQPLVYDRGTGFRTATFSLPINIACVPELDAMEVVHLVRKSWNLLEGCIREWFELLRGLQEAKKRGESA